MSILETIRADALIARKARNSHKATFLVTLLAEAEKRGKDKGNRPSTDDEVVAVVTSFRSNLDDSLKALSTSGADAADRRAGLVLEKSYTDAYLPAMVDTAAVQAFIDGLVAAIPVADRNGKAMGGVMAELTKKFGVTYDKAAASRYVKDSLAGAK